MFDEFKGLTDKAAAQLVNIGIGSAEQTSMATDATVSAVLSQLAKKSSDPDSADEINNLLAKKHSTSILRNKRNIKALTIKSDNLKSMEVIFGDQLRPLASKISEMTGLGSAQTWVIMTNLTPIVIDYVHKNKNDLDLEVISALLQKEIQQRYSAAPKNALETFLEKEASGSLLDELMGLGKRVLPDNKVDAKRGGPSESPPKASVDDTNPFEYWTGPKKEPKEMDKDAKKTFEVSLGFSTKANPEKPFPTSKSLAINKNYFFWLELGKDLVSGAISGPSARIDPSLIPNATHLTVHVYSIKGDFLIKEKEDSGELFLDLPNDKVTVSKQPLATIKVDAAMAKKRLFFPVKTNKRSGDYTLLCIISYNNLIVQTRTVKATVSRKETSRTNAFSFHLDYVLTHQVDAEILQHQELQSLSIYMHDGPESHNFKFFGNSSLKKAANFDSQAISSLVHMTRNELRKVAWGKRAPWPEGAPFKYDKVVSKKEFLIDLARLAKQGYRFYDSIINTLQISTEELENEMHLPGSIQVALQRGANTFLPFSMLYDKKIDSTEDADKFNFCPTFLAALNAKEALEDSACFNGNCPTTDRYTICPSGFWGFKHYLSFPHSIAHNGFAPSNIEVQKKTNFLMAVSTDKRFKKLKNHKTTLKTILDDSDFNQTTTRRETLSQMQALDPHLVYFYCHGGLTSQNLPYLLVGDPNSEKGILRDNIRAFDINWEKTRPLVFLNGCHTTALAPEQAIEFVSAFVENASASGVIGTEITIFEGLAVKFAEAFFKRFLQGVSVAKAVRNSRLELLKNKNPLGLVYIPFVLGGLHLVEGE